jgi:hypothetical protein
MSQDENRTTMNQSAAIAAEAQTDVALGMTRYSVPAIPIINPAKVPDNIESDIAPAVGAPFRRPVTRRSALMNMMVSALTGTAIASPAGAAVITQSEASDDPIFAAIAVVKTARQACNALREQMHEIERSTPPELRTGLHDNFRFAVGSFKGQSLYVSSEEEFIETMAKRLMAVFVERGVDQKGIELSTDSPEKTWIDVEYPLVRKHFNEKMRLYQQGKQWREDSGYDRVYKAWCDADDALTEVQQVLVDTKPTTAAGLVALLELITADEGPYGVDDWQDIVFPTIAEAARKFLT